MPALRFDPGQQFTCSSCARCCHSEVVVTPGERASYAKAGAEAWYRESGAAAEGASLDPFTPLPGRAGWFRIRRRADGTCGFLSPQNRCRLHEELGGDRKPLVCRMYPFSIAATKLETTVKAAFSCPTIVDNAGEPLAAQSRDLAALRSRWAREFGEDPKPLELVRGHALNARGLAAVRETLLRLLDLPGAEGEIDLARNVRRIGFWLEDLARPQVVRLAAGDFAEYATVTGRYAASAERAVPDRPPSRLSRLFARGFVFVIGTAEAQRWRASGRGLQLGLRFRFFRMLAHAHGLGPALPELDVDARRRVTIDRDGVRAIVHHYLRASFETLGSARRPLLDEAALAAAILNAAVTLGAMHAVRAGGAQITAASLRDGLVTAADIGHLDGAVARIVEGLAGGSDAYLLLAAAL